MVAQGTSYIGITRWESGKLYQVLYLIQSLTNLRKSDLLVSKMNLKNFSTYAFQPFFGFQGVSSSFFIVRNGAQTRDLYHSIENSILRRITLVSLSANICIKSSDVFPVMLKPEVVKIVMSSSHDTNQST